MSAEEQAAEAAYYAPGSAESEYDKRNRIYTEMLAEWAAARRKGARARKAAGIVFALLLAAASILAAASGLISINNLTVKDEVFASDVGIALACAACVIAALTAVPCFLARLLFFSREDAAMLELMKSMHRGDNGAPPQ